MQTVTFQGEIQGGRILTRQPLTAFEGKQVLITLSVPDGPPRLEAPAADRHEPAAVPYAPEEAEILEDAGRIRLPQQEVATVQINLVDVGRLPMRVYSSDEKD